MAESKVSGTSRGSGNTGGSTKPKDGSSGGSSANRRTPKGDLEQELKNLFDSVAFFAAITGDDFSATVISARSEELARAWNNLAKQNASVQRVLRMLTEGSQWQEATMVTLSVAIPIAARYGFVPVRMGQLFAPDDVMPDAMVPDEEASHAAASNNGSDTTT